MKFIQLIFILIFDTSLFVIATFEPFLPDLNIPLDHPFPQENSNQIITKEYKDPVETETPPSTKKRKFNSIVVGGKRYYNEEQRRQWREKKRIKRQQMTKEEREEMNKNQYLAKQKKFENLSPEEQEKDKMRQKANFRRHHVNRMIRIKMGLIPKRKNHSKKEIIKKQEN